MGTPGRFQGSKLPHLVHLIAHSCSFSRLAKAVKVVTDVDGLHHLQWKQVRLRCCIEQERRAPHRRSRCHMPVIEERVSVSVKKILLATDFSPASEKAASYTRALARRFSSTVEIAHVFDPSVVTSYREAIIGLPAKERGQIGKENLEHLRDDFAASGIDTKTVSPEGHRPSAALLKAAKEDEVDLIVAGTQSKSRLERLVLGSTAEQLIRSAECPVLTVGPKAKPVGDAPLAFQAIVCATDFSAEATKAAIYALSFAQ